jgi:hypothetical protein
VTNATGQWFFPGPPVSSANGTDRHDITEIMLKVALNTIKQTNNKSNSSHDLPTNKLKSEIDEKLFVHLFFNL